MAGEYLANQLNAEVHRGEKELDDNIIARRLPVLTAFKPASDGNAQNYPRELWSRVAMAMAPVTGTRRPESTSR